MCKLSLGTGIWLSPKWFEIWGEGRGRKEQCPGPWHDRVQQCCGSRRQGTVVAHSGDGDSRSRFWPQGAIADQLTAVMAGQSCDLEPWCGARSCSSRTWVMQGQSTSIGHQGRVQKSDSSVLVMTSQNHDMGPSAGMESSDSSGSSDGKVLVMSQSQRVGHSSLQGQVSLQWHLQLQGEDTAARNPGSYAATFRVCEGGSPG